MSFSFTAMGTKADVLAQLALAQTSRNAIGEAARDLAVTALEAEDDTPRGDYQSRFVVEASGHSGGGSALSLSLTIRPVYVPVTPPPA